MVTGCGGSVVKYSDGGGGGQEQWSSVLVQYGTEPGTECNRGV